ncbi:MAG: hypothetical protein IPI79_00140 [Moraxellaceae bacterium]|nr:hypothetical protein [Moraxellaceae bacterium]
MSAPDVALLKIKADNLPVVHISNPDVLKVGQPVLAIGSPFGLIIRQRRVLSVLNHALCLMSLMCRLFKPMLPLIR